MKKGLLTKAIGLCFLILSVMVGPYAEPAQSAEFELSFTHTIPPVIPMAKVYEAWAKQIESKSNGRVKINFYWSESLLKASEFYRGVQTGQTDITYYVIGLDWGLTPLNLFVKLGFMGFPSVQIGTEIYKELLVKFPQLEQELKGVKLLAPRMGPPYHLHFVNKKVRTPADLKGMKVISVGASLAKELAVMGAAPMDIKVGDLYMSLERGLAEGISAHIPILHGFGILELVPNHVLFEGGAAMGPDMILFNLKSWNKLPKDIQKIFEDSSFSLAQNLIMADVGYENMIRGKMVELKHDIYTPSEAEMVLWRKAVQPEHEQWIEETEAKGLPARALYNETKRLIAQYK